MKEIARNLGGDIESVTDSRSPGLVPVKRNDNPRPDNEKRDRDVNPRKPMKQTKSNVSESRPPAYVGIDLHKKTLQIEIQDPDGNVISNGKVQNTPAAISRAFTSIPQGAQCVIESSSVWYEVFRFIRDDLGYEVVLSNPAQTKAIAASKKKTDKIDAHTLADLLRGGYIAESHVPDKAVIESRQLVRYRHEKVEQRTQCKNGIHGILLQDAVKIGGSSFSNAYIRTLHKMDDYRIEGNLKIINCIDDLVIKSNAKINAAVSSDRDAQLLKTIPGVGAYTALVLSSAIDDVGRFPDSHSLVSYFGLAPSVRNSAETTHHGRITKRGSKLVRHVLVEAAHSHVRFAPGSKLTQFYKRISAKRGNSKAAVATAAKMVRVMYQMLKHGSEFQP